MTTSLLSSFSDLQMEHCHVMNQMWHHSYLQNPTSRVNGMYHSSQNFLLANLSCLTPAHAGGLCMCVVVHMYTYGCVGQLWECVWLQWAAPCGDELSQRGSLLAAAAYPLPSAESTFQPGPVRGKTHFYMISKALKSSKIYEF